MGMKCYTELLWKLKDEQSNPFINDIDLYDTSSIASGILWYQLIRYC
jgi:hypothetical protein